MLLSRLLLYSSISFLTACAVLNEPQATITPSPAPTATVDWSGQRELTLYGTGDYGIPPFEAIEATTLDGESVVIDITLIFSISTDLIKDGDLNNWDNYLKNEVIPAIRETVAVVVVQYAAREIYGVKGFDVQSHIETELKTSLASYGLIIVESLLRDIQFSLEINDRIEEEIVATQYASLTAEAQLSTVTP